MCRCLVETEAYSIKPGDVVTRIVTSHATPGMGQCEFRAWATLETFGSGSEKETIKKEPNERADLSVKMRSSLPGRWKNDTSFVFTYNSDGSYSAVHEKGNKYEGKWDVNDGKLILVDNKMGKHVYDILSFSDNSYMIKDQKRTYVANRVQ